MKLSGLSLVNLAGAKRRSTMLLDGDFGLGNNLENLWSGPEVTQICRLAQPMIVGLRAGLLEEAEPSPLSERSVQMHNPPLWP